MKVVVCPSGNLFIEAETKKEIQQLKNYYCDNRTFSGHFFMDMSLPEDQYTDGTEQPTLSFTPCPDDGHVLVRGSQSQEHNIKY